MKKFSKRCLATLLTVILISISIFPMLTFAQSGTMGTETPTITAAFTDAGGKAVDGNSLETGEYTVSIKLSGMKTVSIFQFAASYTDDMTINSVATIADNNPTFSVGAIVNEDNSFVAIIASENDDTSAISDGEVMVTLTVTMNTAGDFADYFTVLSDPDLTFTEADYGDGYESCYVLAGNEETAEHFPYITADMSPVLAEETYSVAGQITIATDVKGTNGTIGIIGITASVDVNGEIISAVTDSNGYYTLTGIPEGTYTMVLSGSTTVDRNVTLVVSKDKSVSGVITVNTVPVVICNYSGDGNVIDEIDLSIFGTSYKSADNYNVYCDLTGDGRDIDELDLGIFGNFYRHTIEYDSVTL